MAKARGVRVFLDASALFAGIWSEKGGARAILKLGEAQVIELASCPQVIEELEEAFREKGPELLGRVALILEASNIELIGGQAEKGRKTALSWIEYSSDANVLASALMMADLDYFVTLDKQHFLSNSKLRKAVSFEIGTPGDFLAWYRVKLATAQ